MENNSSIKKKVIKCPFCTSILIKQYFSTHMKKIHPNSTYSTIIKKGMKFNFFEGLKEEINNDEFFCNICNAIMKNNSKYLHLKTKLHKKLSKMNNIGKTNSFNKIFFVIKKEKLTKIQDNQNLNRKKLFKNDNEINYNIKFDGCNILTNKFNLYTEDKINVDSSDDYYSLSSVKKSELNYSPFSINSQIVFKKIDVVPFNFIDNYESKGISSIKNETYFSNQFKPDTSKNYLNSMCKKDSLSSLSEYKFSYDNSFSGIEEMKIRDEIDEIEEKNEAYQFNKFDEINDANDY